MPEFDRREFLKIVGVGAGAAASTACHDPLEQVIPYLNQPEEIVPGIATHYYSTCRECPAACSLDVKTREGRPIKVDGNPNDPASQGSLCVRGQASLYRTYDAARFAGPMVRQNGAFVPTSLEAGIALLVEKLVAAEGRVAFLGGLETGTLDALIDQFLAANGSPNRVRFELFAHEALRSAHRRLFGTDAIPQFDLAKADVLVAFGTDYLETWLNPLHNQVGFAQSRRNPESYAAFVGPRLGLSGANTDTWIQPAPGSELLVALALAQGVARRKGNGQAGWLAKYRAERVSEQTGVPAASLERLAERIARARAPLALPPGSELLGTNATAFVAAVQVLNHVSGAIGKTVVFGPDHKLDKLARFRDLKELAGKMRGGEVGVLMVHGVNPVYAVPQVGFGDAMDRAGLFTVSFSSASDETTAHADLVLPDHTPYESWGDAEPVRGVKRLQQPSVRPLKDTRALGDVLVDVAGRLGKGDVMGSASFRDRIKARWGGGFEKALAAGGRFTRTGARAVTLNTSILPGFEFEPAQLGGDGDLVVIAYPSLHFYDGRSARIAMLQEVPDPVLKATWGSYAEIHPESEIGKTLERGDIVRLTTETGSIELPAFPSEAVHRDVVAIAIGQGFVYRGSLTFLPVHFKEHLELTVLGWDAEAVAGAMTAVVLLAAIFGQIAGGTLSDRIPVEQAAVPFALLTVPFLVLMAPATGLVLIAAAAGFALMHWALQPIVNGLITDYAPEGAAGQAFGIAFFLVFGVGSFAGSFAGLIAERWGTPAMFYALAAIAFAMLIGAWVLRTGARQRATLRREGLELEVAGG